MHFLTELHPFLGLLILCTITVSIAYAGLKIVRRKFSEETLRENHEVGGFIFNAFGLIYAVLVAFVVFATWTEYDNSKKNVDDEAIEINDLYQDSKAFPDSLRRLIHLALADYAADVINDEWPLLTIGETSEKARNSYIRIVTLYTTMDVSKLTNLPVYSESLKHLNDLGERRRNRIFDCSNTIPGIIWAVLLFGSVMTVIYTYFFSTKKFMPQFLMTAGLTALNTMILYMIYMLDKPFSGSMKIGHEAFVYILEMIKTGL
jgi:hypothetical protein